MLKSEKGFKTEFQAAVQNLKSLNTENLYVHVRSYCDSLFKSDYFPLIDEVSSYDYDVFEYIIGVCKENGIKVHAWINPYRVLTSSLDINKLSAESPAYKWYKSEENKNNVICMNGIYLNPAEPDVRELVINGVREILTKYKVDGIHLDDYFYPTTDEKFDSVSYEKYKVSAENPLSLSDWRRGNVNALISGCYNAIKFYSSDVLFSVSPAADIDKNYSQMYADIKEWVVNGYVDCIIPQIYFGFRYPDPSFGFDALLDRWENLAAQNHQVDLLIGIAPYKIGTDAAADKEEWNSDTDTLAKQAEACYKSGAVKGYILFSYTSLFSDNELNVKQRENLLSYINSVKN